MTNRGQKPASGRTPHTIFVGKPMVALKESDNRFTSPDIVRAIENACGKIDFDPCWHPASAVNPKAYLDVRQGDDGLRDDWCGRFVFVNPPWSAQDRWVKRAYSQWKNGNAGVVVCLVPAKTDALVFHEVLAHEADIFLIKGRPHFFREDAKSEGTMHATMLVVFGATAKQKSRIATLLQGAWWEPCRSQTPCSGPVAHWVDMTDTLVPFSCMAQHSYTADVGGAFCKLAGRRS